LKFLKFSPRMNAKQRSRELIASAVGEPLAP